MNLKIFLSVILLINCLCLAQEIVVSNSTQPSDENLRGFYDPFRGLQDQSILLYQIASLQYNLDIFASPKQAKRFLFNHGCYCYPMNTKSVGPKFNYNGPPVDALDRLCKKLWQAKKCIDIVTGNGLPCNTNIDYDHFWHPNDNKPVCINSDECSKSVCNLEIDFNNRVSELLASGRYAKDAGVFSTSTEEEYNAHCFEPPRANPGGRKDECCGEGIERRFYNDVIFECCGDQTIKQTGTCDSFLKKKRRRKRK